MHLVLSPQNMEQLFSVKVCVHDAELQEVGPNVMV
jgi:hypothetical protein